MIEDIIVEQVRNDGTIAGIVSTFENAPAVFSSIAPENARQPFVVIEAILREVPDYIIDSFDVDFHYFEVSETRVKARTVAERIEFIFDPNSFQTDRYADIRFYRRRGFFVPESDTQQIHYIKQMFARGSRKKWMEQLP